ncbi:MAG: insulinase family protein, partial [Nevskiales bacterium]
AALDEELARFLEDGPSGDELERIKTSQFAGFVKGMERIGGFGGKSDILARSQVFGGSPDAYQVYLQALRNADDDTVQAAAQQWLSDGVFVLSVEPFKEGKTSKDLVDRSQLPAAGTPPALALPALQRFKLSNGLDVVLAERHEIPVVQISLVFDAGYAADAGSKPGTASMTLGMLDEGTQSYDALALAEAQQRLGANITTASSLDTSTISLSALSNLLDPSLALYAEVVRKPAFPASELQRLKQQRLAGIAQEKAQPMSLGLRVLPPLLYGNKHAYGLPLTGSGDETSTRALQLTDLRHFHESWIRPDNASLVIVGDTQLATIKPLLEEHFGDWQVPAKPKPSKTLSPVERPAKAKIYLMDRPQAEQTVIIAGHVIPPTGHDADIAMETLNSILGGMFTSRLNLNLREDKHWAYGARSLFMDAKGQRPFIAYAPVQADKTAPAMQEILKELQQIKGPRPPKPPELRAAQDNLTLKLPGQHETSGQVMATLLDQLVFNLPDNYYNQYVSRVRGLKQRDMQTAADVLLHPEQLTWVVVGDLKTIEAPVRKLGIGEVQVLDSDGKPVK